MQLHNCIRYLFFVVLLLYEMCRPNLGTFDLARDERS